MMLWLWRGCGACGEGLKDVVRFEAYRQCGGSMDSGFY